MLSDTAVILAGGKSSRMGFDKQFIKLKGKNIVEYQLETLRKLFSEIIIVTNKPDDYRSCKCRLVSDELRDFGPLGGIHAGLKASNSLYSYFIACDMPNINAGYITFMMERLKETSPRPQAAVTRFGNWIEPFNAFYSKDLIPSLEHAYRQRQLQISKVLGNSNVLHIEEEQARSFSPDWDMFININTIEDLEKLNNNFK